MAGKGRNVDEPTGNNLEGIPDGTSRKISKLILASQGARHQDACVKRISVRAVHRLVIVALHNVVLYCVRQRSLDIRGCNLTPIIGDDPRPSMKTQ